MHGYIDFNIDDHREDYHHMQTYSFVHCLCCYQVQCMPLNHPLPINPEKRSNQTHISVARNRERVLTFVIDYQRSQPRKLLIQLKQEIEINFCMKARKIFRYHLY